jgi:hypothetical protein
MCLEAYDGTTLAATFTYGKQPTYHGPAGQRIRAVIDACRGHLPLPEATVPGVPVDWLAWVASVVYPTLAAGAFVRWRG